MKGNKSIVISICFDGLIDQIACIQFVSDLFKMHYGKVFSDLYYTITDKTKTNWKQKTRGGKFTEKRFFKFTDHVSLIDDKISVDFELLTNQKNYEYKSRDIDISFSHNQMDVIKSITSIISVEDNETTNIKELLKSLVSFLLNQKCNIWYGSVFIMENIKLPAFYVHGIQTENLTPAEEEILSKWADGRKGCNKKIWGIFWGNIISKNHLNGDSIKNIKKTVGEENVFQYADNLFWFNLPESLNNFELTKYSTKREELHMCFQKNNLLL